MNPGAIVAIVVAVVLVLVLVGVTVAMRARGIPVGGDIVVRCSRGHLYTTTWIPGGSLKAVRLGTARYQRCPVGKHWALTRPVPESQLTPEEASQARSFHDAQVP
ncbi:MAG: hypothetical protein ABR950_02925 [Candidatus Dormibacteria bacterium]|jgi:hypothetical protein